MTPAAVLAEIDRRGAIAYRAGDTIRLRPASALPPALIEAIRQHKAELLALVPEATPARDGIAPPRVDPAAVYYQAIYAAITASTGTVEDLAACSWWYDLGHRGLPRTLAALEERCEALARAGAPEPEYRVAVEELVAFVRTIRIAYRAAHRPAAEEARDVANFTPSPAVVGIADPCFVCGGTEYRPPRNGYGWWRCTHCDLEPHPGERARGRR